MTNFEADNNMVPGMYTQNSQKQTMKFFFNVVSATSWNDIIKFSLSLFWLNNKSMNKFKSSNFFDYCFWIYFVIFGLIVISFQWEFKNM